MSLDNVSVHLIETMDDVFKYKEWIGSRRPRNAVAIDTETTGLDRVKDYVRLAQVGDTQQGWAIPWNRWSGVFEDTIKTFDGEFILHNSPFDVGMLDKENIKLPRERIHDTRVRAHILEPHMSTALKQQTTRHVDPRAGAAQKELEEGLKTWGWKDIPITFQPYWAYACIDTVLTAQLFEVQQPKIDAAQAHRAVELEEAYIWTALGMEEYGVHIDVDYATKKRDEFLQYCDSVERWCKSEYNVSPGSNAAIIKILDSEGYDFTKRTASGALALDRDVLEGIDHPLANAVLRRRQLQKMATTYLTHYIDHRDADDLIHPRINTFGARTGRQSMQEPNFQNLPRTGGSNPAGDAVRNGVSAREGHTLIFCDFDQIEMRILADFANEPAMIDAFKSEGDFFVNMARQIYSDSTIEKKDPRRQTTKNSMYAKIYSAGLSKFALTAGISETEASGFLRRVDELYPGIRRYQNETISYARSKRASEGIAYVQSQTGRMHVADEGKDYALGNYRIQGWAAELFKMKCLELDAAGLGQWMMLPVHDEIIFDIPNEEVNEAVYTIQSVMNDDTMLKVPITAGVSYGHRWGEKRDWTGDIAA